MPLFVRIFAVLACLAAAPAALADSTATPADNLPVTRWSDSAEITVNAKRCPNIWKLQRGNSILFVMATLSTVPDGMSWDSHCFNRLLSGSARIILPGGGGTSWTPQSVELPGNTKLRSVISPALHDRLAATVTREGLAMDRYEIYKPQWVGAFLMGAVYQHRGLRGEAYPAYIPYLAKQAKVPIQEISVPTNPEVFGNLRNKLDAAQAETCLTSDLDMIDYNLIVLPRLADAWGRGDLAALLRDYRDLPEGKCLPPGSQAVIDAADADLLDHFVRPLDAALSQPGKSVAVLPLGLFLRKDWVLDQLKKRGVDVIAPAGTDDGE